MTESWRGVCEGEWVVAERARASLFEFIGVLLILATVALSAFCGGKVRSETRSWGAVSCARPSDCCPRLPSWTTQRYVARRKAKQIAAVGQKYIDDAKAEELGRIKEHHELRANEEKRLERERGKLKKMSAEDAQEWWTTVQAREEAHKAAHREAKGKWQTAVHKQLWRLGKVAEGGKPNKVMVRQTCSG